MTDNKVILLVDDSESDLFLLKMAFKKAEIDALIQEVYDGQEAIAYLVGEGIYADRTTHPLPSIVLLDLNMPRKNGFDVMTWARSQSIINRIPIVVITASLRTEDVERAFVLGANAFLLKPTTLNELISMATTLRDWFAMNHLPPGNPMVRQR